MLEQNTDITARLRATIEEELGSFGIRPRAVGGTRGDGGPARPGDRAAAGDPREGSRESRGLKAPERL